MHTVVFGVGGLRISRSKEINKKIISLQKKFEQPVQVEEWQANPRKRKNLSNLNRRFLSWGSKTAVVCLFPLKMRIMWWGRSPICYWSGPRWWQKKTQTQLGSTSSSEILNNAQKNPQKNCTFDQGLPLFRAWDPVPSTKLSFVIFRDCLWFFVLRKNRPVQPPGAFLDWNGVDL